MWSSNVSVWALTLVVCIGMADAAMAHFSTGSAGRMGEGTVTYSVDNNEPGAWTTSLTTSGPFASWYSRLELGMNGYSGSVTVTWQLQRKIDGSAWSDVTGGNTSSSVTLSGTAQIIYATSDGAYARGNHDWGTDVAAAGTYRVVVTVESA